MTGATTSAFGRTAGTIVAIVVAAAMLVGGYVGWGWYKRANAAVQDKTIVTADSLQKAMQSVQKTADARQATLTDSLSRLVTAADVQRNSAQIAHVWEMNTLKAQKAEADSALGAALAMAHTAADTAAAEAKVPSLSLDSAMALLSVQHAADSGATAIQLFATRTCNATLEACRTGRARADSIAGFWQTKYNASAKKVLPKWQSITIEVVKDVGIALVTRAIVK